ncbi:hypothetical protein M422DRAFT_254626 [Sphaerobolus stellatus SS14]|uniref:Unplaced genomic scaffold SPHSTscaffold_56, whole genome shotgun sequence n=1 Tax=Sphaerobolus stellatus (strain SS14) TaxID=990650 RepID=A0A0C9VKK2_SPHS4|nr:hypothetical protein M422DRAFT_254626 [Sphaerobolus stellatus SS14]
MEEEPDQIASTTTNASFNYRCNGSSGRPGSSCSRAQSGRPTLCPRRKAKAKRRTSAPGNDVFPGDICPVYVADINTWKEDFEVREAAIDWEDDEVVEFGATTAGSVCFIECGERFAEMNFYRILDMAQPITALDDDVHELIFDTASPLPVVDISQVEWTPVLDVLTAPPNTPVISSVPHSSRRVIVNRTSSDGDIEEAIVAPVRKRKPPGEPVEQDRHAVKKPKVAGEGTVTVDTEMIAVDEKRKRKPPGEPVEQDRHAVKKPKVAGEGTVTVDTEMIAVDEKRNVGAVPKKRNEPLQSDEAVWQSTKHGKTVAGRKRTVEAKVAADSEGAPSSGRMSGAPKVMVAVADAANTQQPVVVGDGGAATADDALQGAVAKGEG